MIAFALILAAQQPGPWNNDLMIRVSERGGAFGEARVFATAAGVPSLCRSGSKLVAAFQWFPLDAKQDDPRWDRVAVKTSTDNGVTWSEPQTIRVEDLPETYQRPFDPTVVALPSGKIRMYFTSTEPNKAPAIYSAISDDGLEYTFEPGARFAVEGARVIDSAVLRHGSTWHLIAPIGRPEDGAYHAISSDGLKFAKKADIESVGRANWTGNLVLSNPGLCFYGSSDRGLWWSYSTNGSRWSQPSYLNILGGDPAVVNGDSRRVILVYVAPRR